MLAKSAPKAGVKGFALQVMPTRDALDKAINADGFCDPRNCWHYVAISALLERLDPGAKHFVKVDAGHIKINYRGWRYVADTPRHVKRSLLLFDQKLYDKVHVRVFAALPPHQQDRSRFRGSAKTRSTSRGSPALPPVATRTAGAIRTCASALKAFPGSYDRCLVPAQMRATFSGV